MGGAGAPAVALNPYTIRSYEKSPSCEGLGFACVVNQPENERNRSGCFQVKTFASTMPALPRFRVSCLS
jgi:hypothetical protein